MAQDKVSRRAWWWLGIAASGALGGLLLGQIAVGDDLGRSQDDTATFAALGGNPDALSTTAGAMADPCYDCADSYGVAARLRSARDTRMDGEFRELGSVDVDYAGADSDDDDYRYGGGFDTAPVVAAPPTDQPVPIIMTSPVGQVENAPVPPSEAPSQNTSAPAPVF